MFFGCQYLIALRAVGRAKEFPKAVRFEGAEVHVAKRSDGRFALWWREAGTKRRTTIKSKADALQIADDKARELARGLGHRRVSQGEAEQLEMLKQVAGAGEGDIFRTLQEVREARKILEGRGDLVAAARWYRQHGPAKGDPMAVSDAVKQFLAEYDQGSKATRRTFGVELEAFADRRPGIMVADLTERTLREWVDRKTEKGAPEPRTVRKGDSERLEDGMELIGGKTAEVGR